MDNVVRLLAPYLPYAAEEVWSWYRTGSVHVAPWPTTAPLRDIEADEDQLTDASAALSVLRKFRVLTTEFTEENGLLTPSMKVKRKQVLRQFSHEIDALYGTSLDPEDE